MPIRVFIIDDEPPARTRLKEVLGDLSAELATTVVGEASNGQEALIMLATTPVHLIFGRMALDYFAPVTFTLAWLYFLVAFLDGAPPRQISGARKVEADRASAVLTPKSVTKACPV